MSRGTYTYLEGGASEIETAQLKQSFTSDRWDGLMRKSEPQWEGRTGILYILSTPKLEFHGAEAGPPGLDLCTPLFKS